MNIILKILILSLFVNPCNGQNKSKIIEKSKAGMVNFIDKKFIIDKNYVKGVLFTSKKLDRLFNINNKTYMKGTSFLDLDMKYHLETVKIMNSNLNDNESTYILSYNNEILCDTLKIRNDLIIDCNVIIKKNKNGRAFCLRLTKSNKLQSIYVFDKKNKIIKMPSNTAVKPSNVINLDDRE